MSPQLEQFFEMQSGSYLLGLTCQMLPIALSMTYSWMLSPAHSLVSFSCLPSQLPLLQPHRAFLSVHRTFAHAAPALHLPFHFPGVVFLASLFLLRPQSPLREVFPIRFPITYLQHICPSLDLATVVILDRVSVAFFGLCLSPSLAGRY